MSHTLATAFFTGWWQALVEDGALLPCRLLPSNTLEAYEALLHHGGCDLLLAYVDPAHPLGLEVDEVESFTVAYDRLAPYSAVTDGRRIRPCATRSPDPFSGPRLGRVPWPGHRPGVGVRAGAVAAPGGAV